MLVALLAGGLVVAVAVAVWLVRLAVPARPARGVRAVTRHKEEVLRQVHAEGLAARRRIRYASRHGVPGQSAGHARARRPGRWLLAAGVPATVAAITAVLVVYAPHAPTASTPTPSRLAMVNRAVQAAQVGDCVNFTGDVLQSAAPADPGLVPCSGPVATFRVVWLGAAQRADPCPARFFNPKWWSDGAGKVACTVRIYHAGQCMAGPRTKDGGVTWYYNAVVPCSLPPGPGYAYVVRVLAIVVAGSGRCPYGSYVQRGSDDDAQTLICVGLVT